jgi:hypothetical protein
MKLKLAIFAVGLWLLFAPLPAAAHCDTMNGPVVAAARQALQSGDVTPVLKWVRADNEAQVRAAFARARKVRSQGADAAELADMYFFETLVRLHRSGEGEPYTGLKTDEPEPGIAAADGALESGNVEHVVEAARQQVAEGIRRRFARVQATRKLADTSVAAGREYVEAYVAFLHYVESVHGQTGAEHGTHAK